MRTTIKVREVYSHPPSLHHNISADQSNHVLFFLPLLLVYEDHGENHRKIYWANESGREGRIA